MKQHFNVHIVICSIPRENHSFTLRADTGCYFPSCASGATHQVCERSPPLPGFTKHLTLMYMRVTGS